MKHVEQAYQAGSTRDCEWEHVIDLDGDVRPTCQSYRASVRIARKRLFTIAPKQREMDNLIGKTPSRYTMIAL